MDAREYIATQLYEARRRSGYTAEKVGKAIGKSRQAVNSWECGRRMPDQDTMLKLAKIYGVSITDLYPPDPKGAEPGRPGMDALSVDEWRLVRTLRRLDPEALRIIADLVDTMERSGKYGRGGADE